MTYRLGTLVGLSLVFVSCSAVNWIVNGPPTAEKAPPIYERHALAADTSGLFLLTGTAREVANNEPVLFGTVAIYENDKLLTGTETNFDGNYTFRLDFPEPTMLTVEFSYLGLETTRIDSIVAQNGQSIEVDVQLRSEEIKFSPRFHGWSIPLIEQDNTTSGRTFTSDEIRRSGVRGN